MASVDSTNRKAQQADQNDLQAEYAEKRKKLARQKEAELNDVKNFYEDRKASLIDQNEAAINHIRKTQMTQGEKAEEQRKALYTKQRNNLTEMNKKYSEELTQTQAQKQQQIATVKEDARDKVESVTNDAQDKIVHVREQSQEQLQKAKEKQNHDIRQQNEFGEKRIAQVRQSNESALHHEVEKGSVAQDKLRENQQRDYEKIHETGDQKIAREKEIGQKKIDRVKTDSEKRYSKTQEQWNAREAHLNQEYTNRLEQQKDARDQELKTQNRRFASTYEANEEQNRDSLEVQQNIYTKQIGATQKKFLKAAEKYHNKEDDPFYKVEDRGSQLREFADHYVVQAYVPEHEKDLVKVNVHPDKVTISGQRSFKDSIEEEDKKISTNSYQSFREELPFGVPVVTNAMTREREGDWVVFKIPKITRGFSKKA